MSHTLRAALRSVADARANAFAASEALRLKRERFDTENVALVEYVVRLRAEVDEAEREAKALIASHYEATKETRPVAGAEVKLFSTMSYDDAVALAWARETKMALVPESLDRKNFEKIAKATPLPFVTYGQEPRVTIASQLNAALLTDVADPTTTNEVSA